MCSVFIFLIDGVCVVGRGVFVGGKVGVLGRELGGVRAGCPIGVGRGVVGRDV